MISSGQPSANRNVFQSSYTPAPGHRFKVGDRVRVKASFPPGHRRTPYYIRGKIGEIERVCGAFPNPEELAYQRSGLPAQALYRVRFLQQDVWPIYRGGATDTLDLEIYDHWLEPA